MVHQYRPIWQTENGGTGYSVFHAAQGMSLVTAQAWADSIRQLFSDVGNRLPVGTNISFPGEVLELNTATGELAGVQGVSAPDPVAGSGTGAYSAPTGCRIRWNTNGIVAGRRVAGTTFFVPLYGAAFDDAGTIEPATIAQFDLAASTYLNTLPNIPVVYSRPNDGSDGGSIRPGTEHIILSSTVPDRATVLRSRRD